MGQLTSTEEEEKVQRDANVFEGTSVNRGMDEEKDDSKVVEREEREYIPEISKVTQFFSHSELEDLWHLSAQFMKANKAQEIEIYENEYRIEGTYTCATFRGKEANDDGEGDKEEEKIPTETNVRFAINILKIEKSSTHCIEASLLSGKSFHSLV